MNLLPKSHWQFSEKEYWDKFFKVRGANQFEWYGNYDELWPILKKYIKITDHMLVVGCGNSRLSVDLYDNGIVNNVNVDISDVVIKQMNEKYVNNQKREGLKFVEMDILNCGFEDQHFNVVLDKGTLDAIASDDNKSNNEKVDQMFAEISRILKCHGRYICISLLQTNIFNHLLKWFTTNGQWIIRIQRCFKAETTHRSESGDDKLVLPVFVVICTKLNSNLTTNENFQFFEVSLSENVDAKSKRLNSTTEVINEIVSLQQFSFIQNHIKNFKIKEEDNLYLDLYDETDLINPKYTLYFVDHPNRRLKHEKCAVFIVPQGRETEWLFATFDGRIELAKQAKFSKIIVVHLNRYHRYKNLDEIKSELSGKVLELLPKKIVESNDAIPFLSIGGDDIGNRKIIHKGHSEFSGDYVIEDINLGEDEAYRRLIFLSSQNIIQSEAKLKSVKKGKKTILTIDHSVLACKHHEIIICGLVLLRQQLSKSCNLLLVGLGGGCLPNYIQNNITNKIEFHIDVVEIDKAMLQIAMDWFEMKKENQFNNVKINHYIDDGIKFINLTDNSKEYDYIILDVDSKSQIHGISCPPAEFLELNFIKKLKTLLDKRNGLFILNLVCRNKTAKSEVYEKLKSVFPKSLVFKIKNELNEIVFAFSNDCSFSLKDNSIDKHYIDQFTKNPLYISQLKDCYLELFNAKLKVI